jgi:uncharacterized protein YkwD
MHVRSIVRPRWAGPLAMLLAGTLVLGFTPTRSAAKTHHGPRMHMVALTNGDREKRDRRDVRFSARLSHYAKRHSRQMARKGYLFHSSTAQLQHQLASYDWSIGGENVGVGGTLESLEGAFMASPEHRQNILRRTFHHVAVGIVHHHDRLWVTVIFYG